MSLRLLITGASGQVGWQLQRTLACLGDVTALTRDQLDLSDLEAVAVVVRDQRPDVLVNAAAYTAVDKAETEPELAHIINALAPARMGRELAGHGGLLVHYSTDYVFDGSKPLGHAYGENEATGPLNAYGRTKLEGEHLILASGCPHLVLRTTWVYDTRGKNFLRTVLRLAAEREELRMVSDQYGAPTWARTIAEATALIVARSAQQRTDVGAWQTGVFHLSAAGQTSWAGFASAILQDHGELSNRHGTARDFSAPLQAKRVVPIRTEDYPTPACRPRNSVLSNAKVQAEFGVVMPDWRSQLRLAIEEAVR